jgi:hypothetical protein
MDETEAASRVRFAVLAAPTYRRRRALYCSSTQIQVPLPLSLRFNSSLQLSFQMPLQVH